MARRWFIVLAGLALTALVAFVAWPSSSQVVPPVPPLTVSQGAGLTARLLAPQPGLTVLQAQITGRVAAGPDGVRHEWPALHASARFDGTAVTLRFDDASNRWRITVDGAQIDIARPGRQDLLISGLAPGVHDIRAEKISEAEQPALFGGFFLGPDARALPPPAPLPLVEFIGDSDTVGLADQAQRRDCSSDEVFATTDTSLGYAPQVARRLGMDYRMIARSGIGLLRNYGGAAPEAVMERIYPLALPADPAAPALPDRKAALVVIALGSNAFGSPFVKGERWQTNAELQTDFGPALAEFAGARAADNPDAVIVLLAFGEYGPELIESYEWAAARLTAKDIANRLIVLGKPERTACAWHPSASDHAMIAQTLLDGLQGLSPGQKK